jgi:hypothetical protein
MQRSMFSLAHSNKTPIRGFMLLLAATFAAAESGAIEVKPGKWGVNSETTTPMSTQPVSQYLEECVDESFDPVAEMVDQGTAQQCTITNIQDSDNKLDADLQCTMPGVGTVQGKMSFVVNDTSGTGVMNMSMNLGGQLLQMSTKWSGEYLGASCS